MNLDNITEYKYFESVFMSLITEIKLIKTIMWTSDNKTSELNNILN